MDGLSTQRDNASTAQAVQGTAYSAFHGGRIIALVSIEQAMRDQAVYVGRVYLKDHASISTLTALPETRHPNRARTFATASFLRRSDRPKIARLLLFCFHASSPCKDARMIRSIPPPFNNAILFKRGNLER